MKEGRIVEFDILKGIGIISVIAGHGWTMSGQW